MKRVYLSILICCLLTSCVHDGMGSLFSDSSHNISDSERDHNYCTDYGFMPGTPEYGDCRMKLDERRHNEETERSRRYHEERMMQSNITRNAEMQQRQLEHERMLEREKFDRAERILKNHQNHNINIQQNNNADFNRNRNKQRNFMGNMGFENMHCTKDSQGNTQCHKTCIKGGDGKTRCGKSVEEIKKQEYYESKLADERRRQKREKKRQEIIRKHQERQRKYQSSTRTDEEERARRKQEHAIRRCQKNPELSGCKKACFPSASGAIICS